MIELGMKLKELRLSKGYTQKQLSDKLELTSDSTISQWERGVNAPYGKDLVKLTNIFNVSSDYLLGLDIKSDNETKYTYFPTEISAGLPLEVDGIIESSKITVSDELLGKWSNNRNIFFAHINGDSMNRLMEDGSLIAIKPVSNTDELKNGDIVVYSVGGEYSVKHYYKYGDTLVFKPNSTIEHEEHTYNAKEDNVQIHGVVVTYVINRD